VYLLKLFNKLANPIDDGGFSTSYTWTSITPNTGNTSTPILNPVYPVGEAGIDGGIPNSPF
jgi:hypothetical protein